MVSCQRLEFTNAYATVGMADNSRKPELRKVKLQPEYDTIRYPSQSETGNDRLVPFCSTFVLCKSRLLTCT